MNLKTIRDLSESVLTSMTEKEYANWHSQIGGHVVYYQGRYWQEVTFGFYEPIHWLARLSAEQAKSPVLLCWGYRTTLCNDDIAKANSSIPIQLLTNIQNYTLQSLGSNRRNHLRRCYKRTQLVQLTSPALLEEQGYDVLLSSTQRTGHEPLPSKEDYLASLQTYTNLKSSLILAGLVDNKLGGYITGYAINGTAYIHEVRIATEAYSSYVGIGLVFEFVQACRRSGEINEVVYGLHSREDSALCVFKESMGFPAKHIPTKVKINPIIRQIIRNRYPHKYYRLTGYI